MHLAKNTDILRRILCRQCGFEIGSGNEESTEQIARLDTNDFSNKEGKIV